MALSGAVVVAVYTAGYSRTEAAAQRADAALAALKAAAGTSPLQAGGSVSSALTSATIASTPPAATGASGASGSGAPAGASSGAAANTPPASGSSAGSGAAAAAGSSAPASSSTPAAAPPAQSSSAPAAAKPVAAKYKNGSYTATGWGPHGPMQVTVVVKKGRIASANVTQCGTTYPCNYMQPLAQLVVSQQSAPVDYVSGATASSMAYQQAVTTALSQA